ncbi:MAG: hypothetical protein KJ067_16200 [Vicinamibacteria bacterium]|nr:hypothetical protein [Vicinamibacteria bacterium]
MTQVFKSSAESQDEDREVDFELAWQRKLTTAQRFEMMLARSRQIAQDLIRRGHREPAQIVKRA